MKRWFATPAELRKAGVLGLNGRNGSFVMRLNKRSRYPDVDDKVRCKKLLEQRGMPVPGLIGQISYSGQSGRFDRMLGGREKFVIKPASGSGGDGILVITGQRGGRYISSGGRLWDRDEISHHLTNVISGLYSLGGQPDTAMIEELVEFDPVFEHIAFQGVPDIRVIVYRGVPIMSMVRLPTRASDGKANLHQGAIGAGISIASGKTIAAVIGNHHIEEHVDTGMPLLGFEVPEWDRIVLMAAHCYEAVQLGYLGVDIVLDRNRGPLILELNARPGLNIQIANHGGLRARLDAVDASDIAGAPAEQRALWAKDTFGPR
ncbi:alpha-L-glutamate ligase-like protein [Halomonas denitrificans]|nr:alpha-L-glutamate ligase-like protein [Halomonas denitrificans]